MDPRNHNNEVEKLSQILTIIQNLYEKKKEQLEEIKEEIEELRALLNFMKPLISNHSFSTADELLSKSLSQQLKTFDHYISDDVSEESLKDTDIKRKIFSGSDEDELLCLLHYYDYNRIEIKFLDPLNRDIREASADFINIFLRGALLLIKENNPNLEVEYNFYKSTDKIEIIHIKNVKSIEEYDLITSKIRDLLACGRGLNQ